MKRAAERASISNNLSFDLLDAVANDSSRASRNYAVKDCCVRMANVNPRYSRNDDPQSTVRLDEAS